MTTTPTKTKNLLVTTAIGSNSMGLVPPDDDFVLAQARQAFLEFTDAEKRTGSAVQRLAYAVMCHYSTLVNANTKTIQLSHCTPGSVGRKTLYAVMEEFFIGKPVNTKDKGDDETAVINRTRNAQNQLLARAFNLAVMLADNGVSYVAFDQITGVFSVPSSMLVPKVGTPRGRLASNLTVKLDSSPAAIETKTPAGEPKLTPIRTSVSQLMTAQRPPVTRAPGGAMAATTPQPVKAMPHDVEGLIKALHVILCETKADGPVHKDTYKDKTWNMLGDLAQWYDKTVNNPAFNARPTAAKKAA